MVTFRTELTRSTQIGENVRAEAPLMVQVPARIIEPPPFPGNELQATPQASVFNFQRIFYS